MNYIAPAKNLDNETIQVMNVVLKERSKGKSRIECAKIAGIKNQRIHHWYTEGKHNFGKENVLFHKHLKSIEEELSKEKYGKEINVYRRSANYQKRRKFLRNIRKGQTRKDASKNADIKLNLIDKWNALGKKGIKPFQKFHRDYIEARNFIEEKRKAAKKSDVTVTYLRNGKNHTNITIKGILSNAEKTRILNKLKFFDVDMKRRNERKMSNKTKIEIEYKLNINLLNRFENTIKDFGWTIES